MLWMEQFDVNPTAFFVWFGAPDDGHKSKHAGYMIHN
jgi:hypothetical protein